MDLVEVKSILKDVSSVNFQLEDGTFVPEHFHVTEVGMIHKNFIDCGGTVRNEKVVSFQLWNANDYDHRLKPMKLLKIIELSEDKLGLENAEIEVEYQGATIGKYSLGFNGKDFILLSKKTACLAPDQCGIPEEKPKIRVNLKDLQNQPAVSCCSPESGCC